MVKVLQDIWILSEGGLVLYHRIYDEKIDEQLLGALMSALSSFAEEIVDEGLSNFEVQNQKFTLFKKKGLLFIAKSPTKVHEKKVIEELNKIVEKFFQLYSNEILNSWDGDNSIFSNFEKEIEDSLEETIKKFQNAFW
ncbi:MAG: hypothetical protein ACFE8E_15205 [Candidatus Hodarchaeota archaeon]